MREAWHSNIPNTEKAFNALRAINTIKGKEND